MTTVQKIMKIVLLLVMVLAIFVGIEKKAGITVQAADSLEATAAEITLADDEEQTQQFYIVIVLGGLLMLIIIVAVIVAATSVVYSALPPIFKDVDED